MNELEMEIGRNLGASAFYVYQTIKHNPGFTTRDLEIETGISTCCLQKVLLRLVESKIVSYIIKPGTIRTRLYKLNQAQETWKIH